MNDVEVLISAMFQNDTGIVERTGVRTDALLINQCDREGIELSNSSCGRIRCISTTERGLSKSRNMAVRSAEGSYCLLCDDDEQLFENYAESIRAGFRRHKDAAVVCFQIRKEGKRYSKREKRLGYLSSMKISSWQIAIRTDLIRGAGIEFDERFGSGTPRGAGEENIFLFDCLKAGLKLYYIPICIGELLPSESHWFTGYNDTFFVNLGACYRRMMGLIGYPYCITYVIRKRDKYRENMSMIHALRMMYRGMREKSE